MAQKIKIFEHSGEIKKRIKKLSEAHQRQAMEFIDEAEFQIESFIKHLQIQEEAEKCMKVV
jgi:hypothetical protein